MFHRPRTEAEIANASETEKPVSEVRSEESSNELEASSSQASPAGDQKQTNTIVNSKPEGKPMTKDDKDKTAPNRPLDIPGGYQPQAATQPPRVPGAYNPAAFSSSGTSGQQGGSSAGSSSSVAGQGRRLIIGQGITMSGEIESCEYLIVEGTVEAALKGADVLEISETGTFYGTVEIQEATIAGRFEGDISCNGRLTITASGSITGTISYKELAVEAGATLDGKISPMAGKPASSRIDKSKEVRGKTEAAAVRNDNKDSSKDSDELPFAGATVAAE